MNRRFQKVVEQVEQAADAAKEKAKEAGRNLDDVVRSTADGITADVERATGKPVEKKWMRIALWIGGGLLVIALVSWMM